MYSKAGQEFIFTVEQQKFNLNELNNTIQVLDLMPKLI